MGVYYYGFYTTLTASFPLHLYVIPTVSRCLSVKRGSECDPGMCPFSYSEGERISCIQQTEQRGEEGGKWGGGGGKGFLSEFVRSNENLEYAGKQYIWANKPLKLTKIGARVTARATSDTSPGHFFSTPACVSNSFTDSCTPNLYPGVVAITFALAYTIGNLGGRVVKVGGKGEVKMSPMVHMGGAGWGVSSVCLGIAVCSFLLSSRGSTI